jgi:hypothetical protein
MVIAQSNGSLKDRGVANQKALVRSESSEYSVTGQYL